MRTHVFAGRHSILIATTLICLSVVVRPVHADETGALFVGVNHFFGDRTLTHNFTTHRLDERGMTLGLLLPIKVSNLHLYFKGQLFIHDVEDVNFGSNPTPTDDTYYRNLDIYMGGANGLMIGTRVDLTESFYVQPLVGFGVLVNVIYGNEGEGIAYGSFAFDFSAQTMYAMKRLNAGLQLSFQIVPWDGYFNAADAKTLNLSFVVSR